MTLLVGIDCATKPSKTGLALGSVKGEKVAIEYALCASQVQPAAGIVGEWLTGEPRALLALDAPSGWPEALSRELLHHKAGGALLASANDMFHRETDNEIKRRLGKRPLEVGANLIARTAHSALTLLRDLGHRLGQPIPMAWDPHWGGGIAAIEVYLAATRLAHGAQPDTPPLEGLAGLFDIARIPDSPDAQDAILCVLAGADFLRGEAVGPSPMQMQRARQEGWIWAAGVSGA
jgi:hypothetical protein